MSIVQVTHYGAEDDPYVRIVDRIDHTMDPVTGELMPIVHREVMLRATLERISMNVHLDAGCRLVVKDVKEAS